MKHSRSRYVEPWLLPWDERVKRQLRPGVRVLDVGSGRRPAIPPEIRPPDVVYCGLDLSLDELRAAPPGSYDNVVAADIVDFQPKLSESFDLVVSWQVLEHVRPLEAAFENMRHYLVPGGVSLVHLSGGFSVFALLNRVVPHRVAVFAMRQLLGRDPKTVFPAHYDKCWYGALSRITSSWQEAEVIPRYRGSGYFRFLELLERAYLVYEDWALTRHHRNLATHYLIESRR